jgi:NitT/TauT family transport system ATP-binding protein
MMIAAGLEAPSSGEILVDGRPAGPAGPRRTVVFQRFALFPSETVAQNIAFGLRVAHVERAEIERRVAEQLRLMGLARFAGAYPHELSGGMQQRVAIARALAYQPEILLMDEPFASVDAQTRSDLEDLILQVRERYDMTILFVTHDIDESVYLADRIVVLTPAPSTVREILEVNLPRPRDQIETKELPEFAHLRAHVYRLIKRQTDAAAA